jgi:rod shape-determining protein MreC
MYRKQVRRRRAVLLLLVVASFALLSLYYREGQGGGLHRIQNGVATVLGPVQGAADRALKPGRDLVNWFSETFQARGDNDKLKKELAQTREQLATAQTQTQQSDELRKLLKLSSTGLIPAGLESVTARVIGRSPTVWYSTVQVNVGSSSGVRLDDPVVTGDGLVGRVSQVTHGTSEVTLITDHTSSVTARVEPVGATGVIEPEVGNPNDLVLDFVENGNRIAETQTVVTAGFSTGGLDSLFPPGIPIGEVSDASLQEQAAYQRVHVHPFADLRDMEFVQVLINPGNK